MIKDLLNKTKTSISFEVFPPKKEDEFQDVFSKLDALAVLKPDFISCTYGAGVLEERVKPRLCGQLSERRSAYLFLADAGGSKKGMEQ